MSRRQRIAAEVCIDYADIVGRMRELASKIEPDRCERLALSEFRPGWPGYSTPSDPCISILFTPQDKENESRDDYIERQSEYEGEMCDRCLESLKAIRDRKALRPRLGAIKRSLEGIGKREAKNAMR